MSAQAKPRCSCFSQHGWLFSHIRSDNITFPHCLGQRMGAFKALFATCWRAPPQYGSAATHRHQPRDERELSTQQPHAASGAVQHTRAADGDSVKVRELTGTAPTALNPAIT